jgi:hypothetical protein
MEGEEDEDEDEDEDEGENRDSEETMAVVKKECVCLCLSEFGRGGEGRVGANRKPASKRSPAPVVSVTVRPVHAFSATTSSPRRLAMQPFSPSVTTPHSQCCERSSRQSCSGEGERRMSPIGGSAERASGGRQGGTAASGCRSDRA